MAQTTGYNFTSAIGQAGQKADLATDVVDSYAAEGPIAYGVGVIAGTGSDQVITANSDAGVFRGVALFTHAMEQGIGSVAAYAAGDTVSALQFGRVLMETVGAFTDGADAYVIVAAGATQGQATATAAGNLGPIGKFKSTGSGELATVEINNVGA